MFYKRLDLIITPRADCYLSGHLNVQVNDTSTVYMSPINQLNDPQVIDIKNKVGDMTLFPSYIFIIQLHIYHSNQELQSPLILNYINHTIVLYNYESTTF